MNRLTHVLLLILLPVLGACSSRTVPVTVVLNHGNCAGLDAGVRTVTLEDVATLRGSRMFGGDAAPIDEAGMPWLIAVSRGPQPTTGYAFTLLGATRTEATVEIRLAWQTPDPQAMVAQMITHPCIVLGMDDGDPVVVRLDDGTELGRVVRDGG